MLGAFFIIGNRKIQQCNMYIYVEGKKEGRKEGRKYDHL